jgi:hypothetical protein
MDAVEHLEWAVKDVDLALAEAGHDLLPLLAALSRQWHAAVQAGYGRDDISAARLALGGHQLAASPMADELVLSMSLMSLAGMGSVSCPESSAVGVS